MSARAGPTDCGGNRRVRVALALVAATLLPAAAPPPADPDTLLRSLIGKNRAEVERRLGPPDRSSSNGIQTFLSYRQFDSWRTTSRPYPFGYSQGFSGGTSFRDTASFRCLTTLVLVDDVLRSYDRSGIGCR
ncbi:MAG: hypothetical protein J2P47_12460 [Acetobacteraceae bacterium]|nr:hypothetical protein [Acetobacteraceae bacterium]